MGGDAKGAAGLGGATGEMPQRDGDPPSDLYPGIFYWDYFFTVLLSNHMDFGFSMPQMV
jgi:hypothetical protein